MNPSVILLAEIKEKTRVVNPLLPDDLINTPGTTFLQKAVNLAIALALITGSLIFFFMLISGAIKWITGGGDKTRLESAQKQITHAFVGLAILFVGFAIIKLIETLFGINILKFNLPTL